MTTALIQSLIPYLPRYGEEEGDFYSVTREALIDVVNFKNQMRIR